MHRRLLSMLICCLLAASPASAQIYKWVDAQGVVHYSDKPVANAKPAKLPHLQSLDRAPVPAAGNAANQTDENSGLGVNVTLVQPRPRQTFRDGRGLVSAQAAIKPGLNAQQQLIYYLDGQPALTAPTHNTSVQLQGVARGEHQLSVAVIHNGQEISRSAPVTFYMKPPSAITPLNQTAPNPPSQQPAGVQTAPRSGNAPGSTAAPRVNTGPGVNGF